MADVFPDASARQLWQPEAGSSADQVDVPQDRKFIGFDAYKKAMDCLKPGDVAIFATPLAFRWVHFAYAIEKGLNVFMEKPLTADGPTSRRMLKLGRGGDGEEPQGRRGLDVPPQPGAAGTAQAHPGRRDWRHHPHARLPDARAGRVCASHQGPASISELLFQIQRFHSFLWAGGGCFSDFNIHIIDHFCWMKNAWPVKAQALGGRHYQQSPDGVAYVDQNFESYSVEYTFADSTKLLMDGRCMTGCNDIYSSYAHGSKGSAVVSKSGDCGMPSRTYQGPIAAIAQR